MANWISMAERKGSFGGGGKGIEPGQLTMRISKNKKDRKTLHVRFGSQVLEKAKLKLEDAIDLLVDTEAKKGLVKKNGSGYKIKKSGKTAGVISINWNDGLFEFSGTAEINYKLSKDGLTFNLPE